ncbi:MAG TPA: hypothetical protein VLO30_03340, partial [Chthoniobacterales bacterium]|nr:hypothetical protein [Chthoniobacterales bacterium]
IISNFEFRVSSFEKMRINNSKHVPWIVFVCLATIAAGILYIGNFHPDRLPLWIHLPGSLIQTPTEHHTVGGTPLGLWFGSISLAIFVFAALLSLRKKIPLWRVGTVQRWLRAHIWLTILTIPLVILHSGFRFGGSMTTFLMLLYGVVMVSGFYGLFLQHVMPRLMKERLPAETVFEQIPHIRSQLATAAEKMRDSFKPAPPKKADAGAPAPSATKTATAGAAVMASTKGELSTPVARAKSVTGSTVTAAPVAATATSESAAPAAKAAESEIAPVPVSIPNAAVRPAAPKAETIGTPTARVQSDPPGAPVARTDVPAGDEPAPSPPVAPALRDTPVVAPPPPPPAAKPPSPAATPKPAAPTAAKPAPKPAPKPAAPADPASEAVLIELIERQILPYLQARRGDRMRLNNARFSDDTFRFVKLRVTEGYRSRVEEIQGWCDERRMLDLQVRLQHWLHGWLFIHVPFSFLLLMLTIWHACVTLFYY